MAAISQVLGKAIWRNTVLTLTHGNMVQPPPGTTFGEGGGEGNMVQPPPGTTFGEGGAGGSHLRGPPLVRDEGGGGWGGRGEEIGGSHPRFSWVRQGQGGQGRLQAQLGVQLGEAGSWGMRVLAGAQARVQARVQAAWDTLGEVVGESGG